MNEYTEAEIERAARILCEKRGHIPDERVSYYKGAVLNPAQPLWFVVREEVRAHLDLESALKQAKEQK